MADLTAAGPGPAEAPPEDPRPTTGEAPDWGRLLDVAGIVAGVLLIVIVADILSDGRLVSRHLHRPRGQEGDNPGDTPAG